MAEEYEDSRVIKSRKCLSCGGEITEIGANLFCTNIDCPQQIRYSLTHFASKEAMNIEGLSNKTIKLLFNKLNIRKISDIYDLKYSDFDGLEGFKDKKINNLLNAIEKSKEVNLSQFLYALGIKEVGVKTAKDLARNFKSLDNIMELELEDLLKVRDIGVVVAKSIYDYFRNDKNIQEIENL